MAMIILTAPNADEFDKRFAIRADDVSDIRQRSDGPYAGYTNVLTDSTHVFVVEESLDHVVWLINRAMNCGDRQSPMAGPMDDSIDALPLSTRTMNGLKSLGVTNMFGVSRITNADIRNVKGIGRQTAREIVKFLDEIGVKHAIEPRKCGQY